jgi:hypothetical protein
MGHAGRIAGRSGLARSKPKGRDNFKGRANTADAIEERASIGDRRQSEIIRRSNPKISLSPGSGLWLRHQFRPEVSWF